jgi:hypothetical protein
VAFSFLPVSNVEAASYTVIGNTVSTTIDGTYIKAEPATLRSSGWVTVYFSSSKIFGDVDVVFGFNGISQVQTVKSESWEVYEHTTYTIEKQEKTATITPPNLTNTKLITKDSKVATIGTSTLNSQLAEITYSSTTATGIVIPVNSQIIAFNTTDGKSFTYKYLEDVSVPVKQSFIDWKKSTNPITTTTKAYAGVDKWQAIKNSQTVTKDILYSTRFWIDIPFKGFNKVSGKYNIAIKPSAIILDQAIATNQIAVLDPWYNVDWFHRKPFDFTNGANNYQTRILVGKTNAAVGEDVDCGGHVEDDFDDIRFTKSDGSTLLDYWVEYVVDSGGTKMASIWVQNAAVAEASGYMYYGNATVASASSGTNTFVQFDNFEWGADEDNIDTSGGSIAWTKAVAGTSTAKIDTAQAYTGTRSFRLYCDGANFPDGYFTQAVGTTYAIRWNWRKEDAGWLAMTHGDGTHIIYPQVLVNEDIGHYTSAFQDSGTNATHSTWQLYEANEINHVAHTWDLWFENAEIVNNAGIYLNASYNGQIHWWNYANASIWVDNVIVRLWNATEQTVTGWGAEENVPVPSVTTVAADTIGETTANLKGSIDNLNGGANATERGFGWDVHTHVTYSDYANNPHENGAFGVAAFNNNTETFPSGTTIYYRAYAINTQGTGEGAEDTFLTKPAAPTNVSATDGTDTAKVVVTWTKSTGATGYHIYRDGVEIAGSPVGDVATVDDAAADAGTISGGAGCTASDGSSPLHITLNVAGAAANHGTTHTYTMKAHNATGDSALGASTDTGYRDVGALTYDWYRSAADADAAYASIAGEGATTNPYNDATPAAGVGRWYYCHMTATGAANVDTNHNRGYRSSLILTTRAASGTGRDWAIVNGYVTDDSGAAVTSITFTYGTTIAMTQSVTITGSWRTGNSFSTTIRGLSPASVYYFSAGTPTLNFATLGSPNIWEYLNTGCDTDSHNIYGSNIGYQTFTTGGTAHTSIYVRLYLKRTLSPSTVTVSLRSANAGLTEPTGLDLATATLNGNAMSTAYTWYQFTFIPQEALEPNKQYSIVVQAVSGDNANYVNWCTVAAGGIAGGIYGNSVNGGVTYSANTSDALFEVWGYASLQVTDAKVFTNYITTGDWLVTAVVDLTYAPYYNLQSDPASNFQFQLISSAGNIIAATPIKYWDRQPIGLYLQPAQTTALTWGGTYYARIRLVTGTDYQEYPIASTDWKGSDMKWLDQWIITSAKSLAAYDTSLEPIDVATGLARVTYVYTASEILKGTVLNNDGGIIFARGIPSIVERRPDIFQYANKLLAIAQSTYGHAGAVTNWQTQVGTELTTLFGAGATVLGQTDGGKSFGSGIFIGGYVLIAGLISLMGFPMIGFGIGSGILYIAWQWGLMDAGLFFVSCLLFAFFLFYGLFGGKQG